MAAGPALKLNFVGSGGIMPFGQVPQSVPWTLNLSITNIGGATLTITKVNLNTLIGNVGDFVLGNWIGTLNIAAGATDESLTVTFTPTANIETVEQATLSFDSNSTIAGLVYTLQGTCALLPTATNVNASGDPTVTTTQVGVGTATNDGVAVTFAATAIPVGQSVNVTCQATVDFTGTPPGILGTFYAKYSKDGGATWTTFFTLSDSTGALHFSQAISFTIPAGGIANLSTLQVRCSGMCRVVLGGSDQSVTGTLTSVVASTSSSGDQFVQIVQVSGSGNPVAAVADYGNVTLGTGYLGNQFTITNPTPTPLTVTMTPLSASGFSGNLTGTNPVPGNNAGSLTFHAGLTVSKGGVQDFSNAYIVTLGGVTGEQDIEGLYTAPSITPAFILAGDQEQTVVALGTAVGGASLLNYFDATRTPEDTASFSRQLYLDQAQFNKNVNRLFLLYEQFGAAVLKLTMSTPNPKNVPVATPTDVTLAAATDENLNIAVWDSQITGSVIEFNFSLTSGVLSVVGFVLKADEIGEVIENT